MAKAPADPFAVNFNRFKWLPTLGKNAVLQPGDTTSKEIAVPVKDAQTIVLSVVRRVLDLPRDSSPQVVWTQGDSELLVHSDKTKIECSAGVVTITVQVECDQYESTAIRVPIGVGTSKSPSGLVMSTFSDLEGPAAIAEIWSDAIKAFAWETLLEVASTIAAQVGKDSQGRALVPGNIGASPGKLLIQPIARYKLSVGA